MKATKTSQFHHYLIALLLLRTGLQKGEMLALTSDDIDVDHKTLSVTKSRNEFGVNKVIDVILEKTDLHHITPHGLLHTHAIMILESGVDIKSVGDRLSHASINMTAYVYLHITKKYKEESLLKLERYLNHQMGKPILMPSQTLLNY